jgi:hypothetical protein
MHVNVTGEIYGYTCAFHCDMERQEFWHISEIKDSHESPEEG